ncbi:MAG TPA: WD40 repeat domain-containing protein [Urbifossiella sp.]|nr:WD40 repeat domain-containing protein [Urbifossiella sp.]
MCVLFAAALAAGAQPPAAEAPAVKLLKASGAGESRRTKQLAYSPDGKTLLAFQVVSTLEGPNRELLAYDVSSGTTRTLEALTKTDNGVRQAGPVSTARTLAFHPNGKFLWVGDNTGIVVYDWPVMTVSRRIPTSYFAQTLTFTAEGKTAVVGWGVGDYGVDLLDAESGRQRASVKYTDEKLRPHFGGSPRLPVERVSLMPDGETLAALVHDRQGAAKIEFRNVATGQPSQWLKTISLDGPRYFHLAVSKDGKHLAVCGGMFNPVNRGHSGWLEVWGVDGVRSTSEVPKSGEDGSYPTHVEFRPDGKRLAVIDRSSIGLIDYAVWKKRDDPTQRSSEMIHLRRRRSSRHRIWR